MGKKSTSEGATAHFSGHETFPLRQMWLKKVYDRSDTYDYIYKVTFTNEDAIAEFGVGKNMVASIRHWALACNIITEEGALAGTYAITDHAKVVFADDGLDPYAENPTTAWYVHWWLAGRGNRATTWRWLFNFVTSPTFSREDLEMPLAEYARSIDTNRKLTIATISRDIETCIRGYAPRSAGGSPEDYAEPMLGELGLIYEERKGYFSFRRGPKPNVIGLTLAFTKLSVTNSSKSVELLGVGPYERRKRIHELDGGAVDGRMVNVGEFIKKIPILCLFWRKQRQS